MAVISDLVEVVASVEGLETNFVSVYARAAREAGYISQHGRGRNAAKMTTRDAAHLLIAVNTSDLAKNVPKSIEAYASLTAAKYGTNNMIGFHVADKIGSEGFKLVDAIDYLLQWNDDEKSNIDLLLERARDPDLKKLNPEQRSSFKIEFEGPAPIARIVVKSLHERIKGRAQFDTKIDYRYRQSAFRGFDSEFGDRRQTITITGLTLRAVSHVLQR